ncbi:DUF3348 domain-containing protein [Rhodanobacter sp. Root179]|uniref:DUF3348 domain-containing protein n=1 Tax=Rhodanobacter sp. Root179 TaxID=1736482 RepID=UPI0006F33D46|nr:DUF3348 domain-containing protein [Rhodanobacter sp. Root179]KRB33699.1 hypothetical protein ASD82_15240 [Rhodanobacter sp. Root179]
MVQAPQRPPVHGPTFIRLLANLVGADVPPSPPSLADHLGRWLDWSHAIALSTALDGKPAATDSGAHDSGSEEHECTRIRRSLAGTIVGDRVPAGPPRRAGGEARKADASEAVDYPMFRQRHLSLQRSMQAATGELRGRLRDTLTGKSAAMARLAAVDAAMEAALSPREQSLLAHVPDLLGEHFERLHQAASAQATPTSPDAWLEVFRQNRQSVLLAELDVRFQPVEGLLAALRTC